VTAVDALALPVPEDGQAHGVTTGSWVTEEASAAALDQRLEAIGMFRVHHEVTGTLVQPRAGQRERLMRIDRLLTPTRELLARGWSHGAIGIEIKRSGIAIGPALAQAMDYVRGSWSVAGVWVQLGAVFVWPMAKQTGPLASLMVHNRIGSASHSGSDHLKFALGEEVLIADNAYSGLRLGGDPRSGRQVGSR
jgi:hypothetical protein